MKTFLNVEPMVANKYQVHTTTDYSLFKPIDGNRNKNLQHINRIKKSMMQSYLFTAIIVNEYFEIIDGQHRFDAIVDLKLPLNYIVLDGYGLDEVHILNQNAKVWNADDYMNGYCELGYLDYLRYREFKTKYSLGHNETATLLSGSTSKQLVDIFYTGCFKIKDYDRAVTIIEKILMLEPYYSGVRRRAFIYAMVSLLSNPAFEFTEFLQKLKLQPTVMQDCTTSQNYKILIEEVYNYRRHQKVNLRF